MVLLVSFHMESSTSLKPEVTTHFASQKTNDKKQKITLRKLSAFSLIEPLSNWVIGLDSNQSKIQNLSRQL